MFATDKMDGEEDDSGKLTGNTKVGITRWEFLMKSTMSPNFNGQSQENYSAADKELLGKLIEAQIK